MENKFYETAWWISEVLFVLCVAAAWKIHSLIQAAMQFWRKAGKPMDILGMKYNKADPCWFYKWADKKLLVMLLWVDKFNIMWPRDMVMKAKEELKSMFEMKDVGEMNEYVSWYIKRDWVKQTMRFTQLVKM